MNSTISLLASSVDTLLTRPANGKTDEFSSTTIKPKPSALLLLAPLSPLPEEGTPPTLKLSCEPFSGYQKQILKLFRFTTNSVSSL
jgi:hypothetical protein